jgi:catechol 2,3-dioxygenase-like lactoylglutathione lyase family enzyme
MTDAPRPRGIDHIGITVADLEAAAHFLEQAFNAVALYDNVTPDTAQVGADTERTLGLPPGTAVRHMRMMRLGNGASIELFEMSVPAGQHAPALASDLGLQHFAVYCDDVVASADRFEAAGGTLLTRPQPLIGIEAAGANLFCYARAPWGTLIELIGWPDQAEWERTAHAPRFKPAAL